MTEEEMAEYIKKYTPSEVEQLKSKILLATLTWPLDDPYPEYSEVERYNSGIEYLNDTNLFSWLPGLKLKKKPYPEIGPHKAWRDGYEFALNLIKPYIKTGSEPESK